jgi:hypothetical protein
MDFRIGGAKSLAPRVGTVGVISGHSGLSAFVVPLDARTPAWDDTILVISLISLAAFWLWKPN